VLANDLLDPFEMAFLRFPAGFDERSVAWYTPEGASVVLPHPMLPDVETQEVHQQNQIRLQTVQDFSDFSQRMLGVLENPTEEVKREVIRLLVDHIVVEDDAIIIHHIGPITKNERLSLKHQHFQELLNTYLVVFGMCLSWYPICDSLRTPPCPVFPIKSRNEGRNGRTKFIISNFSN
jgi:hypothetical protein